jgi:uncharacterized protein
MTFVLLACALVLVMEGLAFALAPLRIEQALRYLAGLSPEYRRFLGLAMVAIGAAILWVLRYFGAI